MGIPSVILPSMRVIIVCILLVVAVLTGRLSRAVPLLAPTPRAIVAHVPLLLLAVGSVALDFPPLAGHRGYAARVDASGWS